MPNAEPVSNGTKQGIIVAGRALATPAGLEVSNFLDPTVHRFPGPVRPASRVAEVVVHESVTRTAATTVRALARRGLGVHFMIAPDGTVIQHADLAETVAHAGRAHNRRSVGLEVITPYYGGDGRPPAPWTQVISARWAHRGRYVVPTPEQAESVARLLDWLTSPAADGLAIPRRWVGLTGTTLAMARVPSADRPQPGISAHTYWAHADGAWPVLYAWLRLEARLPPEAAYADAVRRATTENRYLELADLLPPPRA